MRTQNRRTLYQELVDLIEKHELHEFLERLTAVIIEQTQLSHSPEDCDRLDKMIGHLEKAQAISEELSPQWHFH